MSSPPTSGQVPGGAPEINTEHFDHTDPFADDEQGASSSRSGSASQDATSEGNNAETEAPKEGQDEPTSGGTTINRVRFGSPSTAKTDNLEKNESHDESVLEKIKTAADDATPEMVERIKSAVTEKFHLQSIRATGPGKMFNPTTVRAHIRWKDGSDSSGADPQAEKRPDARPDLNLLWRSRDNRKGRNSIVVPKSVLTEPPPRNPFKRPEFKASLKDVGKNIKTMFTTFPYWDMAFWSGWSYTIGSALFVMDGLFAWSVTAYPETEFAGEEEFGVPLGFFFGAIFYQIGAVMAYLEAVNDGSFHGSAMRRLLEGREEDQKKLLDEKIHGFFGHLVPHPSRHREEQQHESLANAVDPEVGWKTKESRARPGSIYPTGKAPAPRRGGLDLGEVEEGETTTYLTWRWWPSWHALRTHHVYEIGYLACAIQLFGVTLYGVTAIVVFPGIIDTLNTWQTNAAYWIPQMVAAACFLIASIMFTLETQEKWWKPELKVLGWWIGFWSTVGSVGFELSAAFGPVGDTKHWADYESSLSSSWGSAAYLIGSLLQWYEAINKRPVEEIFNEPGEMKSYQVHPI